MRLLLTLAVVALAATAPGELVAKDKAARSRLPGAAEARDVCRFVAARGPAIAAMLVKDGVLDANNDGVADAVTVAMRDGTMRGEDLAFRPRGAAKGSAPVEVRPEGFQPGDYLPFGARWLRYRGRVYTLYFESEALRHASYLGTIDPGNAEHLVCDFANTEDETLRAVGTKEGDQLCRMVAQGSAGYAPVAEMQDADPQVETGRRVTRVTGRIMVDFANAGAPAPLALLSYESGAGRGCSLGYFDQVVDGRIASSGDTHALLMKLQEVEIGPDFSFGRCDGSIPRWFTFGGQTHIDIATGNDGVGVGPFHEVRVVRGGRVETLCRGDFKASWQVKSMGPEFK
jgi:hypothetical protein